MKELIVFVSMAVLLAGASYVHLHYNYSDNIISDGNVESCTNFNGRDYLLNGGTVVTTSYKESVIEINRLRMLCSGGFN